MEGRAVPLPGQEPMAFWEAVTYSTQSTRMEQASLVKGSLQNLVVGSRKDVSWFRICSWASTPSFSKLYGIFLQLVSKLWTYSYFSIISEALLCCYSCNAEEKVVGEKRKTTCHILLSDFRCTISFHGQPSLRTSKQLHFLTEDTLSAKNLISQLRLPEQFLLFIFSRNWSLPTGICSWEDPHS